LFGFDADDESDYCKAFAAALLLAQAALSLCEAR
jgi:hypothetical protein